MTSDFKIRPHAPAVPAKPSSTPAAEPAGTSVPVVEAASVGFSTGSVFESRDDASTAAGRVKKGGIADDSVGRTPKGGIADDSVGRTPKGGIADDSVGRKTKGGIADDSVGRKIKGGIADDSVGAGVDAVRDSLVGPDTNPDRQKLRAAVFARLEQPSYLGHAGNVAASVQAHVVGSPTFKALPVEGKAQLKTVMSALGDEGLKYLGALVEKNPSALTQMDSKGGTLLSNLAQLATEPLTPSLVGDTTGPELLTSVLRDIVNPNRISQGDAPTCTVTSMEFEAANDEPAEYARLMAGLAGNGRVALQLGGNLAIKPNDGSAAARDGRSISQALFQSAAMEYATGINKFDAVTGVATNPRTGATMLGLEPKMQATMLRQLFGTNYRTTEFPDEASGAKALATLTNYDARDHVNRPIILDIDQGAINHAVTLESVKNGKVTYYDPYGVMRSMPDELFVKYVVAMHAPAPN